MGFVIWFKMWLILLKVWLKLKVVGMKSWLWFELLMMVLDFYRMLLGVLVICLCVVVYLNRGVW